MKSKFFFLTLQTNKNQRNRFSSMVNELRSDALPGYACSILAFFNCLARRCDDLRERFRLRNELIGMGTDVWGSWWSHAVAHTTRASSRLCPLGGTTYLGITLLWCFFFIFCWILWIRRGNLPSEEVGSPQKIPGINTATRRKYIRNQINVCAFILSYIHTFVTDHFLNFQTWTSWTS